MLLMPGPFGHGPALGVDCWLEAVVFFFGVAVALVGVVFPLQCFRNHVDLRLERALPIYFLLDALQLSLAFQDGLGMQALQSLCFAPSLSFTLNQQGGQFVYLRHESRFLVVLEVSHLLLQLYGFPLLPLKEVAIVVGVMRRANCRLESALLCYFLLSLLHQLLKLIIFVLHVVKQSLQYTFLEVRFILYDFFGLMAYLGFVFKLLSFHFLLECTHRLPFLRYDLIEPIVYGSEISIDFRFISNVRMEGTVFLVGIGGGSALMKTFHTRQSTLIQALEGFLLILAFLLDQSLGLCIDGGFESTTFHFVLLLLNFLGSQAFCLFPSVIEETLHQLLSRYFGFGPFRVDLKGQLMDFGTMGRIVGLHFSQRITFLDGSLIGREFEVSMVLLEQIISAFLIKVSAFVHRYFELYI